MAQIRWANVGPGSGHVVICGGLKLKIYIDQLFVEVFFYLMQIEHCTHGNMFKVTFSTIIAKICFFYYYFYYFHSVNFIVYFFQIDPVISYQNHNDAISSISYSSVMKSWCQVHVLFSSLNYLRGRAFKQADFENNFIKT